MKNAKPATEFTQDGSVQMRTSLPHQLRNIKLPAVDKSLCTYKKGVYKFNAAVLCEGCALIEQVHIASLPRELWGSV
jgi:hypothetical protein